MQRLYVLGFRLLTPSSVPTGDLLPGAVIAGVVWSVLQQVGGILIAHDLAHASAIYGVFGIVLGLVAWFSLATTASLYAAKLNVVLRRHLWPRALTPPPLTDADQEALRALAAQARMRPEQEIVVRFGVGAATPHDADPPSTPPTHSD